MFRAVVVPIVCVLALGANASLLCGAWCVAPLVETPACEHQQSSGSGSAVRSDHCLDVSPGVASFLREDVRREISPRPQHAAFVLPFGTGSSGHHAALSAGFLPPSRSAGRPPTLALRI